MIRRIHIDNFKSLDGFWLPPANSAPLAKFTCIVGRNGSGKTSVLQMFDYLSNMLASDPHSWMRNRDWNLMEIRSRYLNSPRRVINVNFDVELEIQDLGIIKWYGVFAVRSTSSEETIEVNNQKILEFSKGRVKLSNDDSTTTEVELKHIWLYGSCLSVIEDSILPASIKRIKAAMKKIISLELLAPGAMRKASRPSDHIGWSGEYLAGFLAKLKPDMRSLVQERVREFFPELVQLSTPAKEYGWRSLEVRESGFSSISSKHVSDGLLRILVIVSQIELYSDRDSVILLDEIENGLHPELLERLVRYLIHAQAQVIVTTHSPMILNYLQEKEAATSMYFLYRNSEGRTRSCRYFDLPSAKKKLGLLGPGEVYVDTSIEQLAKEATSLFAPQGDVASGDER